MKSKTADTSITKKLPTEYTNFSTNVSAQRRAKVLGEAFPFIGAHTKCKAIWQTLLTVDFRKEGKIGETGIQELLNQHSKTLQELLLVKTVDDMLYLLDEDEDGFLNEDEQILLFSTVKERMQTSAEELCSIHEYSLYKSLMKEIRLLEAQILQYQDHLRTKTHGKEVELYQEFKAQKLDEFTQEWEKAFEKFEIESRKKFQQLKDQQEKELEEFDQEEKLEYLRIKPKPILKDLQKQEKLVAIHERYAEAKDIRNELKYLENSEQSRVLNSAFENQEKKRAKLLAKHKKQTRQMQIKNMTKYNQLIINMQRAESRLHKELNSHYQEIIRSQNVSRKKGFIVGKSRDELRRTKLKSRKINEVIKDHKSLNYRRMSQNPETSYKKVGLILPRQTKHGVISSISTCIGVRTDSPLKSSTKNVTKFNIKSDAVSFDAPVNATPQISSNRKAFIFASIKKENHLASLCDMYNEKLELKQNQTFMV